MSMFQDQHSPLRRFLYDIHENVTKVVSIEKLNKIRSCSDNTQLFYVRLDKLHSHVDIRKQTTPYNFPCKLHRQHKTIQNYNISTEIDKNLLLLLLNSIEKAGSRELGKIGKSLICALLSQASNVNIYLYNDSSNCLTIRSHIEKHFR